MKEDLEHTHVLGEVSDILRKVTAGSIKTPDAIAQIKSSVQKVKTLGSVEPELITFDPRRVPPHITGEFETGNILLDDYLGAGLKRGELAYVCGGAGEGKTAYLISRGAHLVKLDEKYTVLHVTAEISTETVQQRYSEALSSLELPHIRDEHIQGIVNSVKGKLVITDIVGEPTTEMVAHLTVKVQPDVVIIDYADLLHLGSGEKRFSELGMILEELRAIGTKNDCLIWTASRVNDDGRESESYLKRYMADLVVSIITTPEEMQHQRAKLRIMKIRRSRGNGEEIGAIYLPEVCNIT